MSVEKFGWADDIVAPRQEINTLSLLFEEKAIQDHLPDDLKPGEFLEAYRAARKAYRESANSPLSVPEQTARLAQTVALFGAKASAHARRRPQVAGMLSCVCPDRPGVLAPLAEKIAAEGGNVEGAVMVVVAGHLVSVLFVSGAAVRNPEVEGNPDLKVTYMDMVGADADWPRPNSTWWHARARGRADASLLLSFSEALAKYDFPPISMSSWREPASPSSEEEVEFVDLNFAMEPDPAKNELQAIRELESEVEKGLAEVHIEVLPASMPTQHRSEGKIGRAKRRDLVMTVVGQAEPGFVHTVLTSLVEDVEGVVDIRGSSVAILEGMTVLTVVFRRAKKVSVKDLTSQIKERVTHKLRMTDRVALLTPIQLTPVKSSKGRKDDQGEPEGSKRNSTHELSLEVPEQSGVVMKVARLLADLEVNITWFVSHIREPVVGERWPVCDIQMHLHVEPEQEDEVGAALRSLAEREGWEDVRWGKWSVLRQANFVQPS